MSPTDATRGTTGPTAAPRRVFLSHTSDLGRLDEPGSFGAATVAAGSAWLGRADSGTPRHVEWRP